MPKSFAAKWKKVIVRRLPPTLSEQAFKDALDKLSVEGYNWLVFCTGKLSTKRTVCARAYLNFDDPQKVLEFKTTFDGHVFVSSRGTQYKCTVDYAPYQKVPKAGKAKRDPREGTIERDSDYKRFVDTLDKPPEMLPSAQKQREQAEAIKREKQGEETKEVKTVVTTPLMEFIQNKHMNKGQKRSQKPKPAVLLLKEDSKRVADKDSTKSTEGKQKRSERKRSKDKDKDKSGRGSSAKEASEQGRSGRPPRGSGKRPGAGNRNSKHDQAESSERTENNGATGNDGDHHHHRSRGESSKMKKKDGDKVRDGHQPWVPRVRITRKGALDRDGNANGGSHQDGDYDRNLPVNSTSSEGQNRGSRRDRRAGGSGEGRSEHQNEGFDEEGGQDGDGGGTVPRLGANDAKRFIEE
ncbi:hypothetical protein BSKO_01945 [Bryopsis sp. KO-2023]|nr:hypothetical protein BSKO_01945 [Bryopsis sp. KO-2023]